MQIRTPKKYQGAQRRSVLSCRRLSFYLLMLALIGSGIAVALNHERLAPIVQSAVYALISQLEDSAATMQAPAPTPTPDPRNRLIEANNTWLGGALGEATRLYMDIAASLPNSVEVFRRITLGLINGSRYDEAVDYGERAINADPLDAEAWAIYAWALDWHNRAAEALAKALHARELNPSSQRANAYLAEIYSSLGQLERGDALLEELLEDAPDSPDAIRARGLLKWQRNDFTGALEDFRTAYSLADNMAYIAIDIAIIEKDLGNFETGQEFLQQVIDADPYNPHALFRLGEIAVSFEGNPAQAMRYLQDCVDLNPSYLHCHYMLGRAQERLGTIEDAANSFDQAIALGSQNPQHYYWAGYTQILLGNCARALAFLEPGLALARASVPPRFAADIETIIPECDPSFFAAAATPSP